LAIERQFHHLVRTIPSEGLVIHPTTEQALERVIGMGCWTPVQTTGEGGQWQVKPAQRRRLALRSAVRGEVQGVVEWDMTGQHNVANALATLAAARHVGVVPPWASTA
jgi:UDP-N-acetylmuramate: L-alanyl-gamma-D-glutamyl-meso-diaminopimelate ligase